MCSKGIKLKTPYMYVEGILRCMDVAGMWDIAYPQIGSYAEYNETYTSDFLYAKFLREHGGLVVKRITLSVHETGTASYEQVSVLLQVLKSCGQVALKALNALKLAIPRMTLDIAEPPCAALTLFYTINNWYSDTPEDTKRVSEVYWWARCIGYASESPLRDEAVSQMDDYYGRHLKWLEDRANKSVAAVGLEKDGVDGVGIEGEV